MGVGTESMRNLHVKSKIILWPSKSYDGHSNTYGSHRSLQRDMGQATALSSFIPDGHTNNSFHRLSRISRVPVHLVSVVGQAFYIEQVLLS